MSNSSQHQTCTVTLNEIEALRPQDITFTWDSTSLPSLTTSDIVTLTGTPYTGTFPTISSIETIDIGSFTGFFKEEFDGRFPDWDRVQNMCKEYPGLEIAYRKFKEVYKMVKEDYDGKERERRGKY